MEPASDVYVLDQNPGIGRRNKVCPSHLSSTSPWLQLKLPSANAKSVRYVWDNSVRSLYEISKWPCYKDAAHPKSSCCTGSVWGQSWKIECQIRFIQWVGLLINFPLLVQVQRRWDRADSQMGRLRSSLLSLNGCQFSHWPPFCALCCRRDPKPWKVISGSPQHLWLSEGKVVSPLCRERRGLHLLQQQGWCALGNMEPASRQDRRFPMKE